MADIEILLDSNIYFRFAIDFHPLLPGNHIIKNDAYILSVISDLQQEFEASPRLQSKFYWVKQQRYVKNRQAFSVDLESVSKDDIATTVSYLKNLSIGTASVVDLKAMAIAEILNIAIATDDLSMQKIAEQIEVEVFSSLDMLELFNVCGLADDEKLTQVVHFWIENKDLPYKRFIEYFGDRFEIVID